MTNKKGAGRPKGQGWWQGEDTQLVRVPVSLKYLVGEFLKTAWAMKKTENFEKWLEQWRIKSVDKN